jgi:hypothetical protein
MNISVPIYYYYYYYYYGYTALCRASTAFSSFWIVYTVGMTPWTGSARRKASTYTQNNTNTELMHTIQTSVP